MASDRNYSLPRKWDFLNVEETPGTFRRLTEEERQMHDSLHGNQIIEAEAANGKLKTKKKVSGSLPRPKRKESPSMFKAFSWSRKTRPVAALDEDSGQEDKITGLANVSPSVGQLKGQDGLPAGKDGQVASAKESKRLSVSISSSSSSSASNKSTGSSKNKVAILESGASFAMSPVSADDVQKVTNTIGTAAVTPCEGAQEKKQETYPSPATDDRAGASETAQEGEQNLEPDNSYEYQALIADDEDDDADDNDNEHDDKADDRQVTYLGPVVLSPKGAQEGHYVHITVVPGSEVETSSRGCSPGHRQVARVCANSQVGGRIGLTTGAETKAKVPDPKGQPETTEVHVSKTPADEEVDEFQTAVTVDSHEIEIQHFQSALQGEDRILTSDKTAHFSAAPSAWGQVEVSASGSWSAFSDVIQKDGGYVLNPCAPTSTENGFTKTNTPDSKDAVGAGEGDRMSPDTAVSPLHENADGKQMFCKDDHVFAAPVADSWPAEPEETMAQNILLQQPPQELGEDESPTSSLSSSSLSLNEEIPDEKNGENSPSIRALREQDTSVEDTALGKQLKCFADLAKEKHDAVSECFEKTDVPAGGTLLDSEAATQRESLPETSVTLLDGQPAMIDEDQIVDEVPPGVTEETHYRSPQFIGACMFMSSERQKTAEMALRQENRVTATKEQHLHSQTENSVGIMGLKEKETVLIESRAACNQNNSSSKEVHFSSKHSTDFSLTTSERLAMTRPPKPARANRVADDNSIEQEVCLPVTKLPLPIRDSSVLSSTSSSSSSSSSSESDDENGQKSEKKKVKTRREFTTRIARDMVSLSDAESDVLASFKIKVTDAPECDSFQLKTSSGDQKFPDVVCVSRTDDHRQLSLGKPVVSKEPVILIHSSESVVEDFSHETASPPQVLSRTTASSSVSPQAEGSHVRDPAYRSQKSRDTERDKRCPPVFISPPPPPVKPARTFASHSDFSDRSDNDQDPTRVFARSPKLPARLSPASPSCPQRNREKKISSSSSSSEADRKSPEVPPRWDKPKSNGSFKAPVEIPKEDTVPPKASISTPGEEVKVKSSPRLGRVNMFPRFALKKKQEKEDKAPVSGSKVRDLEKELARHFHSDVESDIYYTDSLKPFKKKKTGDIKKSASCSSEDTSRKKKPVKEKSRDKRAKNETSSSEDKGKHIVDQAPPIPPRQKIAVCLPPDEGRTADKETAFKTETSIPKSPKLAGALNAPTVHPLQKAVHEGSIETRPPDARLGAKTPEPAACITVKKPALVSCPGADIRLLPAAASRADADVPEKGHADVSFLNLSTSSEVPLPIKPEVQVRRGRRTKRPATIHGTSSLTIGDKPLLKPKGSLQRSVSLSSTISATSQNDGKDKSNGKSRLRKYWPFRRKKEHNEEKQKVKYTKEKEGERKKDKEKNKDKKKDKDAKDKQDEKKEGKKQKDPKTDKGLERDGCSSSPDMSPRRGILQSTPILDVKQDISNKKYIACKSDPLHLSDNESFPDISTSEMNDVSTRSEDTGSKKERSKKLERSDQSKTSTFITSSIRVDSGEEESRKEENHIADEDLRQAAKAAVLQSSNDVLLSTSSPPSNADGTLSKHSEMSGQETPRAKQKPESWKDQTRRDQEAGDIVKSKTEIPERHHLEPVLSAPRVATPLRQSTASLYSASPHFDGEFQQLDKDIVDGAMTTAGAPSFNEGLRRPPVVVVAVDLGTTHSGYAFSFFRDPSSVYVMSRWAGQEPGLLNHKTLSALLLTPDGHFHSFGLAARNHYHNLLPIEARHWLYFERFKMTLHHCKELSRDTMVTAVNGQQLPALTVFSHVLKFFATHALEQLSDQSGTDFRPQDVRWVVTVPAIWREPAKQLMRQAGLMAGMFTSDNPSQMLIVLEPEAASVYCRRLRMHQLVPETGTGRSLQSTRRSTNDVTTSPPAVTNLTVDASRSTDSLDSLGEPTLDNKIKGSRYIVVDAGGGTVDITVHELKDTGQLVELHRATGGPHGSTGVDEEFVTLLYSIFGHDFVENYKRNFPVGWVNLLTDFESRKRTASPLKTTSFNISLPFTFISEFRKHKGEIDHAVKRHGDPDVEWSLQGMLRLAPPAMHRLFASTLISIRQAVGDVLNHPNTRDLRYLFLVGGFAESPMLQHEIRREFGHLLTVLIPHDVSLAVLRGAVLFGLDPKVVSVRCARLTYGVGVLNRFEPSRHPPEKLVHKDGVDWCTDVFDRFVAINQPVAVGTCVTRHYTPARAGQTLIVLNVYSSTLPAPVFITDPGVRKCGTLCLDLRSCSAVADQQRADDEANTEGANAGIRAGNDKPREILARMSFGDTEISVMALDVTSGKEVMAMIDFLSG